MKKILSYFAMGFLFLVTVGFLFNTETGFKLFESTGEQRVSLAPGVYFQKPEGWALHQHSGNFGGYELTTRHRESVDRVGLYSVGLSELDNYLSRGAHGNESIGAALVEQIADLATLDYLSEYELVSFDTISMGARDWSEYKTRRKRSEWVFYYTMHKQNVVVINYTFRLGKQTDLDIRNIINLVDFEEV